MVHLKKMAHYLVGRRMEFVSWIGLIDFSNLTTKVIENVDDVQEIDEFKTLFIALSRYTHKFQFWTTHYFPWGIGAVFLHNDTQPWMERMQAILADKRGFPQVQTISFDEAISKINRATEQIWDEEPADFHRIRSGFSVHGAGSYGQYFSTFDYIAQEVRWITEQAIPFVIQLTRDQEFNLEQVRIVANRFIGNSLSFLHWMGLDEYPELGLLTLSVMKNVNNQSDLQTLFIALNRYLHRLQGWSAYYFPWGIGALYPRVNIVAE